MCEQVRFELSTATSRRSKPARRVKVTDHGNSQASHRAHNCDRQAILQELMRRGRIEHFESRGPSSLHEHLPGASSNKKERRPNALRRSSRRVSRNSSPRLKSKAFVVSLVVMPAADVRRDHRVPATDGQDGPTVREKTKAPVANRSIAPGAEKRRPPVWRPSSARREHSPTGKISSTTIKTNGKPNRTAPQRIELEDAATGLVSFESDGPLPQQRVAAFRQARHHHQEERRICATAYLRTIGPRRARAASFRPAYNASDAGRQGNRAFARLMQTIEISRTR
jgi:hypothetical protein